MESLYHSTHRSLQEAHEALIRAQRAPNANPVESQTTNRELHRRLEQILR